MNKMTVSPWLMLSSEGPITCAFEQRQLVHVRQGDLDGACGPYCAIIALITLGIMSRTEAENMDCFDGRTREGRFRESLNDLGALIYAGTDSEFLQRIARIFAGKGLVGHEVVGTKKAIVGKLASAVDDCNIPLVSVGWGGGSGHWLTVVGYQGFESGEDFQLTHILCLDPGSEPPITSLWNAVIEVFDEDGKSITSGRLASRHWDKNGVESPCQITGGFVFEVKD